MATVYRSIVDATITITYEKPANEQFKYFEIRIWEQGDDREEAEVFSAEGEGSDPYVVFLPRAFRRSV